MTNSNTRTLNADRYEDVLTFEAQTHNSPHILWRQLTLIISHSPNNLKLHTQRIMRCLDNSLSEYVSGALYDLFVVLGNKGNGLRLRMFNLASPVMSIDDRAYFQQWLSENTDKNLQCYSFKGSVFNSRTCKHVADALEDNELPSQVFSNSLEEARNMIELGQLTQAQKLLEKSYLKKPDDEALQKELQQFYFYSKNKTSMDDFIVRLNDSGVKIAKTWIDLQEISKTW